MPILPTSVVHRRSVTDRVGGWRHYRELDTLPDIDLWRRAYSANYRFVFVPRLTTIKFPAAARRDVYKIRPCHEQAAWSERIQRDDDFEAAELIRTVLPMVMEYEPKPYRVLLRYFVQRTRKGIMRRIRRLLSPGLDLASASVEAAREFKGLPPMP
jgi:GT2 family glycosyltransferase